MESCSSRGLTYPSSQILIVRLQSLCKSNLYKYVHIKKWQFLSSKGHGTGSNNSGSSTPFATTSGSTTPKSEGEFKDTGKESEYAATLVEKLRHRSSFQKARKIAEVATHKPTGGLSKEHREQGRVKIEVYKQYIQAASKAGFAFFLVTTIAQQAASVLATLTLRYWGEHNRAAGNNAGMFNYLLVYGCFSLSSSLLGAISAITMWVYCALRSARYLHDSVCAFLSWCWVYFHWWFVDVGLINASAFEFLWALSYWKVNLTCYAYHTPYLSITGFWTCFRVICMLWIKFSLVSSKASVARLLYVYPLLLSLVVASRHSWSLLYPLDGFICGSWSESQVYLCCILINQSLGIISQLHGS